ncbi:MAG TPA: cytochrome P450 [Acidimicrobiales bacterium]|nr:cytochrome P450 [Acidimicrobiales bacterium]
MDDFNPFDPAIADDPYPHYARVRATDPVYQSPATSSWVLTGYAEVVTALRDHGRFSSAPLGSGIEGMRSLIGSDPPDHTALRRIVQPHFIPSVVAALEPRVRSAAQPFVAAFIRAAEQGTADLVDEIAYPVPVTVIADLLGIPAERREDFKRWSDAMIGGIGGSGRDASVYGEMFGFFAGEIDRRRAEPGPDLISALVNGREPLSQRELLMFCMLLLVAGNETTTNLLGNLMMVLLDRPDVAKRISAEPACIPAVVEECLRFDSPVQALWRQVREDTTLGGKELAAGSSVVVLYGAANRDPAKYPEPDTFDPDRNPKDHVAFGSGIHLCLGASLARLEARVVMEELAPVLTSLQLAGTPERVVNPIVRGLRRLPLSLAG